MLTPIPQNQKLEPQNVWCFETRCFSLFQGDVLQVPETSLCFVVVIHLYNQTCARTSLDKTTEKNLPPVGWFCSLLVMFDVYPISKITQASEKRPNPPTDPSVWPPNWCCEILLFLLPIFLGETTNVQLVGGWTNPSDKYARKIGSFP